MMTKKWYPKPGEISPEACAVLISGLFDVHSRTEEGRTVYDLVGVYCVAGMSIEELDDELRGVHETIMAGSAAADAAMVDLFA